MESTDSIVAPADSYLSPSADEIQLHLDEIRNSTRNISSLAKRARGCPAGRGCVVIQRGSFRAVISSHIIVGCSKCRPNRLVLLPIESRGPGEFGASVDAERGVILGGNHFVDEASDLVPTSYAFITGAGVVGQGASSERGWRFPSLACASGDHIENPYIGIIRRGHFQTWSKINS